MEKILYIIFLFYVFNFSLCAQNKIKIINADNSQILNDTDYIKLTGNCHFQHNNIDIYCDTLYFYDEKNYIEAFNNVKIVQIDPTKETLTIKSDSLKYNGNKNTALFTRNINMQNGDMILLTNHFVYNTKDKIGSYYKGGTILNKSDILKSENGVYNTNTKIADFSNNVSITSSDNIILTNVIKYNNALQIAYIQAPTKIIDNQNKGFIYSEEGIYNTNTTDASLYKGSYYSSDDKYFTADTLLLNQKNKTNTLKNNALIIDKINNIHTVSNFATFNQNDSTGNITNNVLVKILNDNNLYYLTADTINTLKQDADKIHIPDISIIKYTADIDISDLRIINFFKEYYSYTNLYQQFLISKHNINYSFSSYPNIKNYFYPNIFIKNINKSYNKISKEYPSIISNKKSKVTQVVNAYKNVKLFNDSLQMTAGSFQYIMDQNLLYITDSPILWVGKKTQITSKDMVFVLKNSKLYRGYFINSPIIISQDEDDLTKFNQIKGRNVIASFLNNKLTKLSVDGNAESIYQVKDQNKKTKKIEYIGLNSTKASHIDLLFNNNELMQVKYITDPNGSITPYNLVQKEAQNLEGFSWKNNLRPKNKKDLLPKDRSYKKQKYINDL